jgi:hypothetical protein
MVRRWWLFPALGAVLVLGFTLLAHAATTFTVTNNDSLAYMINGQSNPDLMLVRGQTYVFQVSAIGHPFWIKSVQSTGTGNAYNNGVTNNGIESGSVTFTVPSNAPSTLFYDCQIHLNMTGQLVITDATPAWPLTWGHAKALYR